jgi:hypothetical protein
LDAPLYSRSLGVHSRNREAVRAVIHEFLCPSDRGERVSAAFGPTNYAACAGSGGGGGTPFDADGAFFINSATALKDFADGASHTALAGESLLGETPPPLTPRSDADPRLVYGFAPAAPLTAASCGATALWNLSDPPSYSWANGEFRSALYNHWTTPNSRDFDCVSAKLLGPLAERYAAYGWRTSRSNHPGGVHVATADGAVDFVVDAIDLPAWQALATRAGEDDVAP